MAQHSDAQDTAAAIEAFRVAWFRWAGPCKELWFLADAETPEGIRFRTQLAKRECARKAFITADNQDSLRRAYLRREVPVHPNVESTAAADIPVPAELPDELVATDSDAYALLMQEETVRMTELTHEEAKRFAATEIVIRSMPIEDLRFVAYSDVCPL
ncbi:unnamed protein product [Effrenium voratum]|nr:unnamed protein product [Effrenium voratum]